MVAAKSSSGGLCARKKACVLHRKRRCVEDLLLNVYDEYEDYCEEHGLDSVTECLLLAGPVVTANFSNPSI